jgi:hypothetical protein
MSGTLSYFQSNFLSVWENSLPGRCLKSWGFNCYPSRGSKKIFIEGLDPKQNFIIEENERGAFYVTRLEKTFRNSELLLESVARYFIKKKIRQVFKNEISQNADKDFEIENFVGTFTLDPDMSKIFSSVSVIFYARKVPFITAEELLNLPIIKKLRSVSSIEFLENFISFDENEDIVLNQEFLFGGSKLSVAIRDCFSKKEVKEDLETSILIVFFKGMSYGHIRWGTSPPVNMGYVIFPILKKLGPRFLEKFHNAKTEPFYGDVRISKLEKNFYPTIKSLYENQEKISKHLPLLSASLGFPSKNLVVKN